MTQEKQYDDVQSRFLHACKRLGDNNAEIARITQLHAYGIGVSRSTISYLKKSRGKPHTLALVTFVLEFHLNKIDNENKIPHEE